MAKLGQWKIFTKNSKTKKKNISKARAFVESIDKDVTHVVSSIVKSGKIPIIIGGGHNNAYGNIKGCALDNNGKINVVNFDAHTDFRPEEGRHSGNGFSYAFAEGFLKNYFIFGLHENYTSDKLFKTFKKVKNIKYNTYEAIEVRNELDFNSEDAIDTLLKKTKGNFDFVGGAIICPVPGDPQRLTKPNPQQLENIAYSLLKKDAFFYDCNDFDIKRKI